MSKFIVFEGPDGSGKTTQARLIYQYIRDNLNENIVLTKEPGGTKISEIIRNVLLDPENAEMDDLTEVLLYASSRAQHVAEFIKPNLKNGNNVLCDRFIDSTIAYQGYGRGIDIELIKQINHIAAQGLKPDISFYIMTTPEVAISRIKKNRKLDRLEQAEISFHARLYQGYQRLLEEDEKKHYINGNQAIANVHEDVKKLVKKHI